MSCIASCARFRIAFVPPTVEQFIRALAANVAVKQLIVAVTVFVTPAGSVNVADPIDKLLHVNPPAPFIMVVFDGKLNLPVTVNIVGSDIGLV